jgi:Flp pilus assembly protein TadD
LNQSSRAVQPAVFHTFTASTKKEKRSKKERKLLLRLGIQLAPIGALNTYKGKFELAIGALEKAVRLDPSFSEAWYHLSIVYGRAGRKDDASKASAEFSRLKSEKTNRETELLRTLFLQTMSQQ